jgi:hypothetical protein
MGNDQGGANGAPDRPLAAVRRGDSRLARFLRAGAPRSGEDGFTGPALQFEWLLEILFLLIMAVYVTAILVVTGRRPRVAPATLAIGTGSPPPPTPSADTGSS